MKFKTTFYAALLALLAIPSVGFAYDWGALWRDFLYEPNRFAGPFDHAAAPFRGGVGRHVDYDGGHDDGPFERQHRRWHRRNDPRFNGGAQRHRPSGSSSDHGWHRPHDHDFDDDSFRDSRAGRRWRDRSWHRQHDHPFDNDQLRGRSVKRERKLERRDTRRDRKLARKEVHQERRIARKESRLERKGARRERRGQRHNP